MDTSRIVLVGILGLGIGFAAGVFLGPRPPSSENVLRVRVMQAERDNDLLRAKNALLEAQVAEINAVLAKLE